MEEIEIPEGSMAFLEGTFYKIDSKSRVWRWQDKSWRRSLRAAHEVQDHIKHNPSIVSSIHSIVREWDDKYKSIGVNK